MRTIRRVLFALAVVYPMLAQPAGRPEFEVASIRPSGPTPPERLSIGLHVDGAQITCNFLSLKDYLAMAYRLKGYQIAGPDWLASTRFDIAAKLPTGTPRDQVVPMLQTLLEDRFQMKTHRENRDFAVYGLVVAKGGPKFKATPADAATETSGPAEAPKDAVNVTASGSRAGTSINFGNGSSYTFANNRIEIKKLTMTQLADLLARFTERPIVDMTQLPGNYDMTLEFNGEDFLRLTIRGAIAAGINLPPEAMHYLAAGSPEEGLFAALEAVGLKLESRKAPLSVLVIDKMEKTPTEN